MQAIFKLAAPADLDILLVFICEFCEFDQHAYDEETLRPTLDTLLRDPLLGRVWLIQDGTTAIGTWSWRLATAWSTAAATPSSTRSTSAQATGAGALGH
jgi:hypothetical protein